MIEQFLAQHPEVHTFDVLLSDINGVTRGKRLDRNAIMKVFKEGLMLPRSVYATDIEGDTVDETGLGITTGDMDAICHPIPGTLNVIPWLGEHRAQVVVQMEKVEEHDGTFCPRARLAEKLEALSEKGYTFTVAPELEFYLIDQKSDSEGLPQTPINPKLNRRERSTQVYGITEVDDYEAFLSDASDAARLLDVPADTAIAEYGPGQFEVNLKYQSDVVAACDQALMLKRIIKGVAEKHGYRATFMPKPFADLAGNGFHLHAACYDREGKNRFGDGSITGSEQLRHAIGGLSKYAAESMLVTAPSANSYRRFDPDCYTPIHTSWGVNNRSVAFRIPTSSEQAKRVETRIAGADANPYLYCLTVLSAMVDGIENRIEPGPITKANAYEEFEPNLPYTWTLALQSYEKSEWLREVMGETLYHSYFEIKKTEYKKFKNQITTIEYDWYLRHI